MAPSNQISNLGKILVDPSTEKFPHNLEKTCVFWQSLQHFSYKADKSVVFFVCLVAGKLLYIASTVKFFFRFFHLTLCWITKRNCFFFNFSGIDTSRASDHWSHRFVYLLPHFGWFGSRVWYQTRSLFWSFTSANTELKARKISYQHSFQ